MQKQRNVLNIERINVNLEDISIISNMEFNGKDTQIKYQIYILSLKVLLKKESTLNKNQFINLCKNIEHAIKYLTT